MCTIAVDTINNMKAWCTLQSFAKKSPLLSLYKLQLSKSAYISRLHYLQQLATMSLANVGHCHSHCLNQNSNVSISDIVYNFHHHFIYHNKITFYLIILMYCLHLLKTEMAITVQMGIVTHI